jgi:hypothetical protein
MVPRKKTQFHHNSETLDCASIQGWTQAQMMRTETPGDEPWWIEVQTTRFETQGGEH